MRFLFNFALILSALIITSCSVHRRTSSTVKTIEAIDSTNVMSVEAASVVDSVSVSAISTIEDEDVTVVEEFFEIAAGHPEPVIERRVTTRIIRTKKTDSVVVDSVRTSEVVNYEDSVSVGKVSLSATKKDKEFSTDSILLYIGFIIVFVLFLILRKGR